jgi:hypothetical protein
MLEFNSQKLGALRTALTHFQNLPLKEASEGLLSSLGYKSDKTAEFGSKPEQFVTAVEEATHSTFNRDKAHVSRWKQCAFLFQLTNDEIPSLAMGQHAFSTDTKLARNLIESFVFLAIELQGESWSRTDLAAIARELNRRFPMPAIVIFKHGELISLVVIDRRTNLKDAAKDVIDSRITVIKDVRINNPHRAHLDILAGLALENLGDKRRPTNFRELYDAWITALSIQALNKRFYTELAYWYFWAVKQVSFPLGGGEGESKRNSVAVIRLLTRLIFAWFIKEKDLIPVDLFDPAQLKTLLKSDPAANGEDSTYYLAILQNLFFASLNVEMGADRKWAADGGGMKGDRLIHSLYRHKEMFRDPDLALKEYFSKIPFLNGGLFECLDRELTERDFQRNPELKALAVKEGNGYVLRVDGFSRRKDAQPIVPNKIFFGGEAQADLNDDLGTKGKRFDVYGLIDIFGRYKFTVEENTPVEEEVALDPELLGKVFENLLASYNVDTQATARKQSGSFYTPREVVDYMVDEALIAYFERYLLPSPASGRAGGEGHRPVNEVLNLGAGPGELNLVIIPAQAGIQSPATHGSGGDAESKLRSLLSYTAEGNSFSHDETTKLIAAIECLKILDPACGSGAFPMGMLQKLVHVLKKLDPSNELWKTQNRAPLAAQLAEAKKIPDPSLREAKVEEAESALTKFDRDFANAKHADYTRKLYLIEKCIHGVDIQPIAVQIAKLRFFIALVVSQEVDKVKDNWGITALPNLETKIVAADSLTPIDRPAQMGLRDPDIDQKEKELTSASEHYFAARTGKTKRKWRDRIFELRDELAALLEADRFLPAGAAKQLVHWNPFDQNAAADFFDPEWMFQIDDGFDITIGNPPYVNSGAIREIKPKLRKSFGNFFDGNADLFTYFYRRGFDLLCPGGVLAYISSNKFMRTGYGAKTRKLLAREGELRAVIDFGEQPVFGASVDSAIVVVQKPKGIAKLKAFKAVAIKEKEEIPIAGQILAERGESYFPSDLPDDGWLFESSLIRKLLERMAKAGKRLDDIVQGHFYRGILTGFNDAFVIDGATKDRLIAKDPKSEEVIKPFLNGREMLRWRCDFSDQWLLYIPWHFPLNQDPSVSGASAKAEKALMTQYPAIYAHLSNFKDQLLRRNQDETGIRYEWYALQRWGAEYWPEFENRKLVFNETSKNLHAFIDDNNLYINKTGFMIIHDEIDYLLGVMNSSVLDYYYRHNFPAWGDPWNGGRVQFRKDRMVDAPIPWPEKPQRDLVADCVKAIGEIYQRTGGEVAGTAASRYEQLVNGLVFELFFPDDLHRANIRLFDACEKAGIVKLATLKAKPLTDAANDLATRIFASDHSIYAMLFDLQGLDVVRIVEGRE